jgi:putative membrane protein
MTLSDLPMVNASLNGLSAVFLGIGYYFIKTKQQNAHRNCMIAAFCTSIVFLTCYLIYHFNAGRTTFTNPAWFRPIYLAILISHTILAIVIVPLILMSLNRGLKARYELHKKISRWTWPLWMYVSLTWVIIYLLLYQIFPQHGPTGR